MLHRLISGLLFFLIVMAAIPAPYVGWELLNNGLNLGFWALTLWCGILWWRSYEFLFTIGMTLWVFLVLSLYAGVFFTSPAPPSLRQFITLAQHNIWYPNPQLAHIVEILSQKNRPDVVVLQEIMDQHLPILEPLKKVYPYIWIKPEGYMPYGVAIYSKYPLQKLQRVGFSSIATQKGFEVLEGSWNHYSVLDIMWPPGTPEPCRLYELHAISPGRDLLGAERQKELLWLQQMIARDPYKKKILIGDLNSSLYSGFLKSLQEGTGMKSALEKVFFKGTWPTLFFAPFRFSIDHMFFTPPLEHVQTILGEGYGSDHLWVQHVLGL